MIRLADAPQESSALLAAARWIEGTLLGSVATTIAILAVASIGLMMLNGRVDIRRAVTVIVGCFVLFGATSIAAGLRNLADGLGGGPQLANEGSHPSLNVPPTASSPDLPPENYDPFAGASINR